MEVDETWMGWDVMGQDVGCRGWDWMGHDKTGHTAWNGMGQDGIRLWMEWDGLGHEETGWMGWDRRAWMGQGVVGETEWSRTRLERT